ncbi:hypothetical protein N3K66_005595 [Trichothecium roseum]|uniref:Uncharacterized protein n=1 Tax=Trichothecium roseum TaxID=47278 RepID=A0ACC0UZL5_9HYPO|nr:hypothetical protein N3K66_005595 [Trichothecium roseum]
MAGGKTFKLNSGYEIPAIGLGTWQSKPNEVARAVEHALRHGYRHIDAAAVYDNEQEVGAGILASGVPRSEVFLTSKLWNTHHAAADVEDAVDESLRDLGTDYLDLYLVHWPVSFPRPKAEEGRVRFPIDREGDGGVHVVDVPLRETWGAMEALVRKGKVRSIGVSNFTREKCEEILEFAEIKPAVNQIEAHPYLQQPSLLAWSRSQGILVAAYSPSGNNIYNLPRALDDAEVAAAAASLRPPRTPAQLLVQWAVQRRGTVVLPKSVTPSRIEENFVHFELPEDVAARVDALDKGTRYNMPARLGVDVFGEHSREELDKARRDWIEAQKNKA